MTSDNTMPRNKTFTTRKMVTVAMLSAIATVIYYLDFPVPLMPGFIKLDLSNVISLLAGFSMGPIAGVIVCLIKNVIQLIIKGLGTTMGIGNIFDFVTSAAFVLTASVIYQQIMGSVKNIFSALCIFNLPFTFVKGIICALVTILIYKPLSPILKGKD